MEPQGAERQSVSPITAIGALLGAGVIFGAIVIAALQPPGSVWRTIAIETLAVGAIVLTLLLGHEILQRRRNERVRERASTALERFGQTFDEALDELTFPDLLDELAQRATASVDAAWSAILLTDPELGDRDQLRVV